MRRGGSDFWCLRETDEDDGHLGDICRYYEQGSLQGIDGGPKDRKEMLPFGRDHTEESGGQDVFIYVVLA